MTFPNNKQFDEAKSKMEETMKWRELSLGIYHIDKTRDIETNIGEAMISNKKGEKFTVWTPP
jgi:hypothetical protein